MRSRGIAMKVVQIVVLSGTRARRKREGSSAPAWKLDSIAPPTDSRQPAHARRGAADCGAYRQAAGSASRPAEATSVTSLASPLGPATPTTCKMSFPALRISTLRARSHNKPGDYTDARIRNYRRAHIRKRKGARVGSYRVPRTDSSRGARTDSGRG